jgi:hypothetical protein
MSLLALLLLVQAQSFETIVEVPDPPVPTIRVSRPAPIAFNGINQPKAAEQRDLGEPATRASKKLLELVANIDETRTDTLYSHNTKVRRKDGVYHFDCSGMVNWMLERVAPKALETIGRERPVAASYVRVISKAPSDRSRGGWQQIASIQEVEPGDIFAWLRPKDWPKGGNTGHVGVVIARPTPVAHLDNAYVVRIADSTRWRHQDDTRSKDQTGFGMGTILFVTDDQGQPIGYAWFGSESNGWYATDVVFGRVHG